MADDNAKLIALIEANTKSYENAMKKIIAQTNAASARSATSIKKIDTALTRMQDRARSVAPAFTRMAGALAAGLSVKAAIGFADAFTRIQNSLKVAGLEGEELNRVYENLLDSAQRNAVPVGALAELYGKVALAQKELGITSAELAGFTDKIALALRVSGKSAAESSGALMQLSQALGGGTVRAEEFNSVLEGAPTIIQAVAAGLVEAGGSVAKLRQLVIDGKVSSEAFFRAFEAGSITLEDKAAKASFTVADAMTTLNNALTGSVGRFDTATGASSDFAGAIRGIASAIDSIDWDGLISDYQSYADATWKIGKQLNNMMTELFGGEGDYSFIGGPGGRNKGVPDDPRMKGFRFGGRTPQKQVTLDDYRPSARQGGSTSGGTSKADTFNARALSEAAGQAGRLNAALYDIESRTQPLADAFASMASSIISDMRSGVSATEALGNALARLADSLLDQSLNALFSNLLSGGFGGGFGAKPGISPKLFNAAGGLKFGGPRALGGPVSPGSAYLVGEKGPELFVPSTAGIVASNQGMKGGATSNVFNIDARGAQAGVGEEIRRALTAYDKGSMQRHVSNTIKARRQVGI